MKKMVSLFLCIVLIISILPVKAVEESSSVKVMIPCQYVVGHEISQTVISGEIKDNLFYVSLGEILSITNVEYDTSDEECLFFPLEASTHISLLLNLNTGDIHEVSGFYKEQTYQIPMIISEDGRRLYSLQHMLAALKIKMEYLPNESIPLSIYRGEYNIFDLKSQLQKENYLFNWTETGTSSDDALLMYQCSSIGTLIFDYNEHIIKDALFSWWSDDILNVKEEQIQAAMIETLTCFSDEEDQNLNYKESDYETFEFTKDTISLADSLMSLLGVDHDAEAVLKGLSTYYDYGGTLIDQLSAYIQFKNISESQSDILSQTFLSYRESPIISVDKGVRNAAQHLQNRIVENGIGTATSILDLTVDFCNTVASGAISKAIPLYAMIETAITLAKFFPGTNELIEDMRTANLSTTCAALGDIAAGEHATIMSYFRTSIPDVQSLKEYKSTLVYALQSSYTTRKLLINSDTLSSGIEYNLREKNKSLISFLNDLMNCSIDWQMDAVDWSNAIDLYKDVYSAYHASDQLNNFTVHQEGSMSNSPTEERGSDSSYAWESTYYVKGYSSDSMVSSGESHQTSTSSGTNRFTQESYSTSLEQNFTFTYGNAILHGTEEYNGMEYPFTSALAPEEFLDLQFPDISDITSIEVNSDDSYTQVRFFVNASSITEESAHIFNHIIEPVSMRDTSINWFENPNAPSDSGFNDASITVTLNKDGTLNSILLDFVANIAVQDYVKVDGNVSLRFEPLDESKLQEVSFPSAPDLFSRIPETYTFSSGVGGWATILNVKEDGTFSGEYHDSDMGDTGSGYPNGTVQICTFSGKFFTPQQIDEYTYFTKLESIETEDEPGIEYFEDGTRFITSDPYGFDNANGFLIYMPGTPIASLPEGFLSWSGIDANVRTVLPSGYYGIYNVGGEEGFVGLDENSLWNYTYSYTYGSSKSALQPSYYSTSRLTFWPDSDSAASLILTFNWENEEQTEFEAVDAINGGTYDISIDMNGDLSMATVSVQSRDKNSLTTWNGTADGTLVAEYRRE